MNSLIENSYFGKIPVKIKPARKLKYNVEPKYNILSEDGKILNKSVALDDVRSTVFSNEYKIVEGAEYLYSDDFFMTHMKQIKCTCLHTKECVIFDDESKILKCSLCGYIIYPAELNFSEEDKVKNIHCLPVGTIVTVVKGTRLIEGRISSYLPVKNGRKFIITKHDIIIEGKDIELYDIYLGYDQFTL